MDPILIAGFHRSGTSWIARALHGAGVHLGNELLDAEPANPYGHFEDVGVIALHDSALGAQGLSWKSTEPISRPAGNELTAAIADVVESRSLLGAPSAIKDPRLCLFLPEWLEAAPQSRVIVVFRRPSEVVTSLHRRHAQRWVNTRHVDPSDIAFWEQPDLGVRLWVHYNEQLLAALEHVDANNIHVVNWNDAATATELVSTIASKWSIDMASPGLDRDAVLGQPSPGGIEVRDSGLLGRAHEIWARLQTIAHRS